MIRNYLQTALLAAAAESRYLVVLRETLYDERISAAVEEFGFMRIGAFYAKITIDRAGTCDELSAFVSSIAVDSTYDALCQKAISVLNAGDASRDTSSLAAVERQLWPAKVVAPELRTFIVTIKPHWASHFFDVELGSQYLLGLREDLHLGVEGVYFRSAKNNNLRAPGRVLWYVSKGSGEGSMSVKACSQLLDVVVGRPKDLFRRFQRLGVYEWRDVFAAAGNDSEKDIAAFRFGMTERFKTPVDTNFISELGVKGPFMSPREITDSQFASIYRKGTGNA